MMIHLTYTYNRDIFTKGEFKPWIQKLFPGAKFDGFEYGRSNPTIAVHVVDFEKHKDDIPTANLIQIEGGGNVIEHLALGVRYFKNRIG